MNDTNTFTPEELRMINAYECHTRHNTCIFDEGMEAMDSFGQCEKHLILELEDWISCHLKENEDAEMKDEEVQVTLMTIGEDSAPIRQMGLFLKTKNPTIEANALWRKKGMPEEVLRTLPQALHIANTLRFNAIYPECDGEVIPLRLVGIYEWSEGLEATLFCSGVNGDTCDYAFYDTRYALNKGRYEIGKVYTFMLSALMYQLERKEEDWGEEWLRRSLWTAITVGLPSNSQFCENAHVCSEVRDVEGPFTRNGVDFYRLQLEATTLPPQKHIKLVDCVNAAICPYASEDEQQKNDRKAFTKTMWWSTISPHKNKHTRRREYAVGSGGCTQVMENDADVRVMKCRKEITEIKSIPVYVKKELIDKVAAPCEVQTQEEEVNEAVPNAFIFNLTNRAVIEALERHRQMSSSNVESTEERLERQNIKVVYNQTPTQVPTQTFPHKVEGTLWFQGRLV
ncbi:MAG: hypothetical protein IKZ27_03660 [Kiritimatiellae bacterium]|nr:hypothetical protein [Kiritimatiellia bacterium]